MKLSLLALLFAHAAFAQHQHGQPDQTDQILAKAPVVLAGVRAAKAFAKDFQRINGRPMTDEFIGFSSKGALDEANVAIYSFAGEGQAAREKYGCNFAVSKKGEVRDTLCQAGADKELFAYPASVRKHSLEDIEESAALAVSEFAKGGDAALIQKAKVWQAGEALEVILAWTPKGQVEKPAYFMCHYHGAHIDCHRQSRPGPNEPQDQ